MPFCGGTAKPEAWARLDLGWEMVMTNQSEITFWNVPERDLSEG